jgi:hypothetical protein
MPEFFTDPYYNPVHIIVSAIVLGLAVLRTHAYGTPAWGLFVAGSLIGLGAGLSILNEWWKKHTAKVKKHGDTP